MKNLLQYFVSPHHEGFNEQPWVKQLHQGALLVFSANEESLRLVRLVRACIQEVAKDASPEERGYFRALPYETVKQIRERLYQHPSLWDAARDILLSHKVPTTVKLDTPRLRVITSGDEQQPEAAPVYVMHRDTWYGCPQDQLNWWMPIFDTPKEQAFGFFPEYFEKAVPNASEGFEYEAWMRQVGWHGSTDVKNYPQPEEVVSHQEMLRFACKAGEVLVFAAHHLHQTQPNEIKESARWSLDFRSTNHRFSAPNVDNLSRGSEQRVVAEFRALGA
jgi:hypothetical protein